MQKNKAQLPVILPLTMDGIFKMYFERTKNLPQLRSFLKAYLGLADEDLRKIKVLNPGLPKANPTNKGFTVDLLLKTKTGNDIHIEMQTSNHPKFEERVQLCNARIAGEQIQVGEDYTQAKRTISLVITNYRIFRDTGSTHERILMRRENGEIFTRVQEINVVDLTRLEQEQDKEKQLWCKLFKAQTKEELEMLAKESEEMSQATEKLFELSADEQARAYALSRQISEFSQKVYEHEMRKAAKAEKEAARVKSRAEGHAQGHAEGYVQGQNEGRESEKIEIAKSMLLDNIPLAIISKHTGISIEELGNLK